MPNRRKAAPPAPELKITLGRKLAVIRTSFGLNQSSLARLSGVKRALINQYELDQTVPDASTLERLLEPLGLRWAAIDFSKWYLERLSAERSIAELPPGPDLLVSSVRDEVLCAKSSAADLLSSVGRLDELLFLLRTAPNGDLRIGFVHPPDQSQAMRERVLARELLGNLRAVPATLARQMIREKAEFRSWALCELLSLESQRACTTAPAEAVCLAEFALLVADQLGDDKLWQAKLRGFALAHLANAYRVRGNLGHAARTFKKAREQWEAGGDVRRGILEEGLIDALEASLKRAERKLAEALALLECASEAATGQKLKLQIAINRGKIYEETGDLLRGLDVLEKIDAAELPCDDERLVLCVRHNRADYLSKLDRFEEARDLLPAVRVLSRRAGGELDHARLLWTEGRVDAGLGNIELGIEKLSRVRGHFSSQDMDYDTALVSLELGSFYARVGRANEVRTLARHMVPIFQSKKVHREALAALVLFRQAAEQGKATEELLQAILLYLRRARHQPELKFEGQVR
jgi:transcriptional regulator with XRE-family HTH domain